MPIAAFDHALDVGDIGHAMAWNLLSSSSVVSPRRSLTDARRSLALSLTQPPERRGEFRLSNQAVGTRVSPNGEMLLNISRSGIAVGVRKKCTFARGEHYRVTLGDGTNRADLEGRVCWTRSIWPSGSVESMTSDYFQTAGLAIHEPDSREQQERWRVLRALIQEGSAVLDVKISPIR